MHPQESLRIFNNPQTVFIPGAAGLFAGWPELVWPESDTGGDGLGTDFGISVKKIEINIQGDQSTATTTTTI